MLSSRSRGQVRGELVGRSKGNPSAAVHVQPLESRVLFANYFVSPSGSDSAPGTPDQPWLTLQKAADTVAAGDLVTVRAGTYAGFRLTTDGAEGARITFSAEPGVTINQKAPGSESGIDLAGADHVTIDSFRVTNISQAGVRSADNAGVVIRSNTLDVNSRFGLLALNSAGIRVEGNMIGRTLLGTGISITGGSSDGAVVRSNRVYDNLNSGIQLDGSRTTAGDGVITGALVEANVVLGNGRSGGAGIELDGVQSSSVRNNLLYTNHGDGISLHAINGAAAPTNNAIVNNTVDMAFDGQWALRLSDGATGTVVRNNILLNENAANGSIAVQADSFAGLVSDYNIVTNLFQDPTRTYTLAEWKAAKGVDRNSSIAGRGELFVAASGGDYRLSSLSLAIDVGSADGAPASDLLGNPRPSGGGIDAGAYERQVEAPRAFVSFGEAAYTVAEGVGTFAVTVVRTGDLSEASTVRYATADGTAGASDYAALDGTLHFAAGESVKHVIVAVVNDGAAEDDAETFTLTLSTPRAAGLGGTTVATITVRDDDNVVTAAIAPDPWNHRRKALLLRGTRDADNITLALARGGVVTVLSGGASVGSFRLSQFARVIVEAGAGDDRVEIPALFSKPVQISGGDGNDVLVGGRNKDVLIGGAGDDRLSGGRGHDILLGGAGADVLDGGDNNDLLIAPAAPFEDDAADLLRLCLAKNSPRAYLAKLRRGAVPSLRDLLDDGAADTLTGGNHTDWFIAADADAVADRSAREQLNL